MTGPFTYGTADSARGGYPVAGHHDEDYTAAGYGHSGDYAASYAAHPNGHPDVSLSPEAEAFTWQLETFTSTTAGVLGAVAVSSDGLLVAKAAIDDRGSADRLAAVVSGMTSLATGAAHTYTLGMLNRVIVDMSDGYLLISALGSGSVLGVVAERSADLATAAYEMTLFAMRAGSRLTPALIVELRGAMAS